MSSDPKRSDHVVVGYFDVRHDIIIYREPEVGIAWEAEAVGLGQAAMGNTPDDAARNLAKVIGERGTGQVGDADGIVADWEPDDAAQGGKG